MEFSEDMTSSKAGTSPYMSPECINGKPYNKQTDIWSLGVVLYELMTLQLPFVASTMRGVSKLIKKMNYTKVKDIVPEGLYSEELLALVERLMHPE
jgi:serine/threonine protein kinase